MHRIAMTAMFLVCAACGPRPIDAVDARRTLEDLGDVHRGPDETWQAGLAAMCSVHAACAGECRNGLHDYAVESEDRRAEALIEECAPLRRRMSGVDGELRADYAAEFVLGRVDDYLARVRRALNEIEQRQLDQLRADLGL